MVLLIKIITDITIIVDKIFDILFNRLEMLEIVIISVDTTFSMVTCCLMIRLVLHDLQYNKHCVGGADNPPPMPKPENINCNF